MPEAAAGAWSPRPRSPVDAAEPEWLDPARPSLTVFVYHSVTDRPAELDWQFDLNIPPADFERQIELIRGRFHFLDPLRLLAGDVPPRSALITFDDGQRSVFQNALPILARLGVPSLVFLNLGPVFGEPFRSSLIHLLCQRRRFLDFLERRTGPPAADRPAFLRCSPALVDDYLETAGEELLREAEAYWGPFATVEELRAVGDDPLVHFGNHLYNHDVPALLSDGELLASYRRNAEALGAFANSRPLFAFPFGEPDECFTHRQVSLLLAEGAERVFGCGGGINRPPFGRYLDRVQVGAAQDTWPRLVDHLRCAAGE